MQINCADPGSSVGVYGKNANLANPPANALIVVVNWKERDVVAGLVTMSIENEMRIMLSQN
jgi:hypothetical protein